MCFIPGASVGRPASPIRSPARAVRISAPAPAPGRHRPGSHPRRGRRPRCDARAPLAHSGDRRRRGEAAAGRDKQGRTDLQLAKLNLVWLVVNLEADETIFQNLPHPCSRQNSHPMPPQMNRSDQVRSTVRDVMRCPGIEPGSTAWKAAMLTTIPLTLA